LECGIWNEKDKRINIITFRPSEMDYIKTFFTFSKCGFGRSIGLNGENYGRI
jgi:hypothetical protein